jgi:ribonuclease D
MNIEYIRNNEDLDACIAFLDKQKDLAIDLEFDKNRYRYGFNLCLVQIFSNERCFIIDPLEEGIEVDRLFPTLENPAIEKIVYSFGEDLRLLHSLGCFPQNTFDIAIALRLLDYPPASLANALWATLEIEISKSSQKSNWFNRPLSADQIDYAAKDVFYLLDMKVVLIKEANEKEILSWIEEENGVFDKVSYADLENNNYLKEKDKQGLSEHEFHVFKRLLEYRETIAEKYNRPSYQIMDKDYLKELAERPNQIHRFHKIRGVYKALRNEPFKDKLWAEYETYGKEAEGLGLSKTESVIKRIAKEEYDLRKQKRSKRDEAKKKIFKPIQELIRANQGENVVTYIMGNRLMDELASGNISNLRNYKKTLIEGYAAELGFDVSSFFDEKG